MLIFRALRCDNERRIPLADRIDSQLTDPVQQLSLIVVASFSGTMEKDHQRIGRRGKIR